VKWTNLPRKTLRRVVNLGSEISALFGVWVFVKVDQDTPRFWALLALSAFIGFGLSELWAIYLERITSNQKDEQ
jgi:hypothetical protein